jgi:hypothetical protein
MRFLSVQKHGWRAQRAMAARHFFDAHLSALLTPWSLTVAVIDVLADVLDIAAQLVPFVRAHPAAIGFTGGAQIARRRCAGSALRRLGSGTRRLNPLPKAHILLEGSCHREVRSDNRQ